MLRIAGPLLGFVLALAIMKKMGSSALPVGGAAVDRLLDHNKFCSCEQHKRDTDSEDDGCLSVLRHTTIVGSAI
jgi:hypothetical protein